MHIDWNLAVNTGMLVVITATAAAAVIQLSHLRNSNQLQALLTILRMPYDPVLREANEFVQAELAEALKDPKFRAELESMQPPNRRKHKELMLCDYYERVASFIKFGLIKEELYFDNSSPERFWTLVEPAIAIYRRRRGPIAYSNFEWLVARGRAWNERNPDGNYPRTAPRLALIDPWLAQDGGEPALSPP